MSLGYALAGFLIGAVAVLLWQPWRRGLPDRTVLGLIVVGAALLGLLAGVTESLR